MKRRKVHLGNVDGTIYCSVNNRSNYDARTPDTTNKIDRVTCLLCLRRFHRLPITNRVNIRTGGNR